MPLIAAVSSAFSGQLSREVLESIADTPEEAAALQEQQSMRAAEAHQTPEM